MVGPSARTCSSRAPISARTVSAALQDLAKRREQAGDTADVEALWRQAANHGHIEALRELAWRREQAGDTTGADALAVQAANHGNTTALQDLPKLREQAGVAGTDRVRRFGLTGSGEIAAGLDFESPIPGLPR